MTVTTIENLGPALAPESAAGLPVLLEQPLAFYVGDTEGFECPTEAIAFLNEQWR